MREQQSIWGLDWACTRFAPDRALVQCASSQLQCMHCATGAPIFCVLPSPLPQVCHTGGLRQLLPAFVPSFLFGAPSALVDLAVDDARHILYARTQASGLQVSSGPVGGVR